MADVNIVPYMIFGGVVAWLSFTRHTNHLRPALSPFDGNSYAEEFNLEKQGIMLSSMIHQVYGQRPSPAALRSIIQQLNVDLNGTPKL